jgi:hypothetical protein
MDAPTSVLPLYFGELLMSPLKRFNKAYIGPIYEHHGQSGCKCEDCNMWSGKNGKRIYDEFIKSALVGELALSVEMYTIESIFFLFSMTSSVFRILSNFVLVSINFSPELFVDQNIKKFRRLSFID